MSWITCQIGAREHYAIPCALRQSGQLHTLITDVWVTPQTPFLPLLTRVAKPLTERYNADLYDVNVQAPKSSLILFELKKRLKNIADWPEVLARNQWFQHFALGRLRHISGNFSSDGPPILFAYSYAALELFKFAKSQGWYTVLGQIDPGPVEADIVREEHQKYPELAPQFSEPPLHYWEQWQQECELADQIVVNSIWSKQALEMVDIPSSKVNVVPLAYVPPVGSQSFKRTYPASFTAVHPLRVLFLGQVILRKGIAALIEAAQSLCDYPVEFWVVGSLQIDPPKLSNIHWIGAVPRSQVVQYYQSADVFLFPTLSDGFGLTQLEAQAWKLPIIASANCGEVVKHLSNGLLLPEVSGKSIVEALCHCIDSPKRLQSWSSNTVDLDIFSLTRLHQRLQLLAYEPI